ncbi:MAG: hypothetical protein U0470_13110 [Anaerolineae bacterium]
MPFCPANCTLNAPALLARSDCVAFSTPAFERSVIVTGTPGSATPLTTPVHADLAPARSRPTDDAQAGHDLGRDADAPARPDRLARRQRGALNVLSPPDAATGAVVSRAADGLDPHRAGRRMATMTCGRSAEPGRWRMLRDADHVADAPGGSSR